MSFAAYMSQFAALTFKLSVHTLHTCLYSCVKLLQSLLSHCVSFSHFLILHRLVVYSVGHQMLQGATMQQLQQVQVQSQGTPITVNTHAHCLYVHHLLP